MASEPGYSVSAFWAVKHSQASSASNCIKTKSMDLAKYSLPESTRLWSSIDTISHWCATLSQRHFPEKSQRQLPRELGGMGLERSPAK